MTTILGIQSTAGKEGIVLAADTQINYYNGKEFVAKGTRTKIHIGENWAIAYAGDMDSVKKFYSFLKYPKRYKSTPDKVQEVIRDSLKNQYFSKVNDLNREARKNGEELDDLSTFIIATNFQESRASRLGLYDIDEFGNVKEPSDTNSEGENKGFAYCVSGSGEDRVVKYINDNVEKGNLDPENITLKKAIEIAFESLKVAEKDASTGGKDLVVITRSEIKAYGQQINKSLAEAEQRIINSIINEYHEEEE